MTLTHLNIESKLLGLRDESPDFHGEPVPCCCGRVTAEIGLLGVEVLNTLETAASFVATVLSLVLLIPDVIYRLVKKDSLSNLLTVKSVKWIATTLKGHGNTIGFLFSNIFKPKENLLDRNWFAKELADSKLPPKIKLGDDLKAEVAASTELTQLIAEGKKPEVDTDNNVTILEGEQRISYTMKNTVSNLKSVLKTAHDTFIVSSTKLIEESILAKLESGEDIYMSQKVPVGVRPFSEIFKSVSNVFWTKKLNSELEAIENPTIVKTQIGYDVKEGTSVKMMIMNKSINLSNLEETYPSNIVALFEAIMKEKELEVTLAS